jgi:hypothetical protein
MDDSRRMITSNDPLTCFLVISFPPFKPDLVLLAQHFVTALIIKFWQKAFERIMFRKSGFFSDL